jgi:hypothetical protein
LPILSVLAIPIIILMIAVSPAVAETEPKVVEQLTDEESTVLKYPIPLSKTPLCEDERARTDGPERVKSKK